MFMAWYTSVHSPTLYPIPPSPVLALQELEFYPEKSSSKKHKVGNVIFLT